MRIKGFLIDLLIGMIAIAAILGLSTSMPLGIFNAKLTDAFLYVSGAPDFTPQTFTIKNTGTSDLTDSEINAMVRMLKRRFADRKGGQR